MDCSPEVYLSSLHRTIIILTLFGVPILTTCVYAVIKLLRGQGLSE